MERWILLGLLILALIAGVAFFARIWIGITHPVPQIGGVYREGALASPRTINPIFAVRDIDRDLSRLIFSGLILYNPQGIPEPNLAEHYEINPDGKIYTVTLRENLLWHDGHPLEADDVVFTILLIQNALYKSPLRPNWQGVKVEEIDRRTIRFTLRSPYAPFIENLTVGIIPKHLWEGVTPEQVPLHELGLQPIGSGPYVFSKIAHTNDGSLAAYFLKRNPLYYREGPYIRTIEFAFFANEDELLNEWHRGRIDGFGPASSAMLSTIESYGAVAHAIQMPRVFGLFFNQKKAAPLADHTVREAIVRAIDKNRLANEGALGGGIPLNFPLPFFDNEDKSVDDSTELFNPQASRTLLEQAGWKDMDNDGVREKTTRQSGKNITMRLEFTLTTSDWPELLRSAELLRTMLAEIGIAIIIEKKTFAELESAYIRPRNFQILLFGQVYGYEPDPFAFWHSSQSRDPGLNVAQYANTKADTLLEDARVTNDHALRREKLSNFAKILDNDIPAIALFSQLYLYVMPQNMKGAEFQKISLPADRFNNTPQWYLQTKRALGAAE